ncbi:conserved Plasmodium protein, unknown function [Plasmodium berghei]|uniref:RNA-binding protein, putative n=2 Tax=Plasmodium berghei TaxID=5821 RepID=A0A509AJU4_PLABA|nr:RNA-binding protein, putative [Plasmodium berghei ANKA]CXI20515.1 conserved Plasmodium protein, unknown function [Plasmodium berghei]SCM19967.1 conserved Plasmodium protein, unknown function [Plasmodium berghei]SCN23662.1 conserved Plasmodium protein, unknown function [Plasmodium berghei]SCO59200.1 conserved Plasmodium protein, unknown function [Plasmodium berghei]SCO60013.1 conserved Plasmodium protein, unknown function [Plasmodium berghei]|eukprot:XP_034420714.1 RNA-binding protein, putative [Plasmodium berghei ANKA]
MWIKKFKTEKEKALTNNNENQNFDQEIDYTDREEDMSYEHDGENIDNNQNINDNNNNNYDIEKDEIDQNEVNEKIQNIINDLSSDEEEGEVVEDEIPYERVQEKNEQSKEIILLNYYSEISENKLNTLLNIFGNVKNIYTDDNECTHIIFHSIKSAINAKKYIDNLKIKSRRIQVIYGTYKDDLTDINKFSNILEQTGDTTNLNENDEINKIGYDYMRDKYSKVPVKLYKNKNFYSTIISDQGQKQNKYSIYKNYINENQINIKNNSYIRDDSFSSPDKNILLPNSKNYVHMNTHRSRNNYDQCSYNSSINSEHANKINNKGDVYPPPPPPPFFSYTDNSVNNIQNINSSNYTLYNSTNKINKHYDPFPAHSIYINEENTSNINDNQIDDNYSSNIWSNKYKTDLKPNNKYDLTGKGLYNKIIPSPPYLNKDDKRKLYKNNLNSPNNKLINRENFTHIDNSIYGQNYYHLDYDVLNSTNLNNSFFQKSKQDNYMDSEYNNRKKARSWKNNFNEFKYDEEIRDYQFDEDNPFNINSENIMIDNPTWLVRKNTPVMKWDQSASIKDNHINYVNSFINGKIYNRYLLITNIPPHLNENNKLKNYINELISIESNNDPCIEVSIFSSDQDSEQILFNKSDKEKIISETPKEAPDAADSESNGSKQTEPINQESTQGNKNPEDIKHLENGPNQSEWNKNERDQNENQLFAHLTFKTIKNAVDAKKELEEKLFRVAFSSPNKANNCLWVGNIMKNYYTHTFSILKKMLKEFGDIINIKFIIEKNCLFLQYKEIEFAIKARNHLYGMQLSNNIFLNIDFSALGEWEGKQKASFAKKKLLDLLLYDNNFLEYKLEKKYNEKNTSFFFDSKIMKILKKNMTQTNTISVDRNKIFKNDTTSKNKMDKLYREKMGKRITSNRLLDKKNNISYKKYIVNNNKTNSIYDKSIKRDGGKLFKRKIHESEKNTNEHLDRKKKRDEKDDENSNNLYKKKNKKNHSEIEESQNTILFNSEDIQNSDQKTISFYINQKYKCDFNVTLFKGNPKLSIYSKLNVETKSDIKNLKHVQTTSSDFAIWKIHPNEAQKKKFYHICDHFNKKKNIPVILTKERMVFIVPPKDEYLADLGIENLDGMFAYVFETKKA